MDMPAPFSKMSNRPRVPRSTMTQADKGRAFRALHQRDAAFIIPNPWDVGSSHLLAHMGFEALATTSMGYAAAAGVVGGSIEDATGRQDDPIYDRDFAAERIRAAVAAARALPFTFTLTARAENYLHGRPDLNDAIGRLNAYQDAGADVLYAPGLRTKEDIAAVVNALDRPVNVLMGLQGCC
jgi:2-methylisocitrate lyase-like PEP mutase family enzyme